MVHISAGDGLTGFAKRSIVVRHAKPAGAGSEESSQLRETNK
jgi:hypothetical protein